MKHPVMRYGMFMCLMFSASLGFAQLKMPQASPAEKTSTTIGLTDVTLEYARPGVKGRERNIFGGLVPYGEVWRTGANASTKVTFSDSVKVKGQWLPGGTYALYTIPGQDEWTVIFNKNLGLWGSMGYKQEEDALRVKVKPVNIGEPAETFTINFSEFTNNTANMNILWDFTKVSVPLETEVDSKVMAQIKETMSKPVENGGTYFQAANYYYRNGKDKQQALQWVDKAIEKEDRYYIHYLRALILADLNKTKDAIKAAERSRELAKNENPEYVKMNEELIARLGKSGSTKKK
ncbi:DUF2911 domain-containing protein [Cesiribacter sp. SM1]|uniref:DUF2911 domain-containing protein n=1 Tax=Cesiribacter sp. SM1 TaxID=2861196 RepID=UPI001CD5915C|nr:DUF2911 domain-containing protein [Cesiribacter sp. SM1]